jgi:hypothetical protein
MIMHGVLLFLTMPHFDHAAELSSFPRVFGVILHWVSWRMFMQKLMFVTALCLLAGACATRQQSTSTAVGATAGAVVGGPVGAVVGAGAGAVAGAPGGVVDEVQGDNRPRRVVRRRQ